MNKIAQFFLLLATCLYLAACNPNEQLLNQCPPCPNNTECLDGDCGCPPDKHDMGSWCLPKSDNLFVAASLDCYCLDVVGLFLLDIHPEPAPPNEPGHIPLSSYWLAGRGNSSGVGMSNFDYIAQPDGDSIVIYGINMPDFGQYSCQINNELRCQADLVGKFHGPDTIQAQVLWRRCADNTGAITGYTETKSLTFVRKK